MGLFSGLFKTRKEKPKQSEPVKPVLVQDNPFNKRTEEEFGTIAAVIAAAVSAYSTPEQKLFTIRRVFSGQASVWSMSGRQDSMNLRIRIMGRRKQA